MTPRLPPRAATRSGPSPTTYSSYAATPAAPTHRPRRRRPLRHRACGRGCERGGARIPVHDLLWQHVHLTLRGEPLEVLRFDHLPRKRPWRASPFGGLISRPYLEGIISRHRPRLNVSTGGHVAWCGRVVGWAACRVRWMEGGKTRLKCGCCSPLPCRRRARQPVLVRGSCGGRGTGGPLELDETRVRGRSCMYARQRWAAHRLRAPALAG